MNRVPTAHAQLAPLAFGPQAAAADLPAFLHDPYAVRGASERDTRGPRMRRVLLVTDMLVVSFAILLVELVRSALFGTAMAAESLVVFGAGAMPLWVVFARGYGLYHLDTHRVEHGIAEEAGPILRVTTAWAWCIVIVALVAGLGSAWVEVAAVLWGVVAILALAGRAVARAYGKRQAWYLQNALVLDVSPHAGCMVRKILRHPEYKINVVAAVDLDGVAPKDGLVEHFGHVPVIRGVENVTELIETFDIDRVIIGWGSYWKARDGLLHDLAGMGVHIDLIPTWFDAIGARVDLHELEGSPMMTLPRAELSRTSRLMKRGLDICLSAAGLVALTPLLIACAVAIKFDSKGPVLFRQLRVGRDGKRFYVFKFRSMYVDAEERKREVAKLNFHGGEMDTGMFKIREDPRITGVGGFMRRYSLDELPQLLNVLRGEMSIVGPRPLIEGEANQVSGRFRHRLSLTPGLTGLWQVNGRSEIPFDEMVSLDYLYVTNWSLWGDVKLMIKTLPAVAAANGAY